MNDPAPPVRGDALLGDLVGVVAEDVLDAGQPSPRWAWHLTDADTGAVLASADADRVQRTASLGKILLLVEVARLLENGSLDGSQQLVPRTEDLVADSGLWRHLATASLEVRDCAALVGAFSDNLATNVLLHRVGGARAVAATAVDCGVEAVALHGPVLDERGPHDPPTLSTATAAGLATLVARLHRGEVASRAVSEQVVAWLSLNADLSMVAGAFGLDPLCHDEPDRGVRLWNKTGTIAGVRGDAGVATGPGGCFAYAVLAEWDDTGSPAARETALTGMARIGAVLRHLVEGA
ncbi:serine hydrolase [Phycicoccus sp. Root101]|uniref:serine hydrolase n=1 Tax=Phycicoccus sp. Root101 TaxID=1736421 RepID=UPI000AB29A2F|nr:serine hydrolase [Phycicoccus sp. Root101]